MLIRRNLLLVVAGAIALIGAGRLLMAPAALAEAATVLPGPAVDPPAAEAGGLQTAVLAGGCFWGVQAVFQHTKGVTKAVSGYAGGTKESANYEAVSSGRTGHAKSVEVTFDPSVISYGTILQIYFSVAHDPTELNRQGPDEGPQYRSEVFAKDDDTEKNCRRLYCTTRPRRGLQATNRNQGRGVGRILPGRGLSPGLRDPAPQQSLHRL